MAYKVARCKCGRICYMNLAYIPRGSEFRWWCEDEIRPMHHVTPSGRIVVLPHGVEFWSTAKRILEPYS